jgi:hypothetical protein
MVVAGETRQVVDQDYLERTGGGGAHQRGQGGPV